MKKRCGGRGKFNNGGMSLVEVIVAIVVLSVAVIPVLYTFVYSTRQNIYAKERQRAVAVAQTIMENFKSGSVAEIDEQLVNGTFPVGTGAGMTYTVAGSLPNRDYTIEGITYESAAYKATITLRSHGGGLAEHVLTEFTDMNPYSDAVYQSDLVDVDPVADEKIFDAVLREWNGKESTPEEPGTRDITEVEAQKEKVRITNHKIEIIAKKAADDSDEVYVKDFYTYELYNFTYINPVTGVESPLVLSGTEEGDERLIYSNAGTRAQGVALENIYLYYYPGYKSSWSDRNPNMQEQIAVVNETGVPINFYAIKQKRTGPGWDSPSVNLSNGESEYEVEVWLIDNIIMHDNFRVNLFSGASGEDGTSVLLKYGNDSIRPGGGLQIWGTVPSFRTPGLLKPLASPAPTQLMYQIEVVVEGVNGAFAGKELVHLEGTTID